MHPVEYNECLVLAARDHTEDMIKNNIFSHIGSNGLKLINRIDQRYGRRAYGTFGLICDHLPSY